MRILCAMLLASAVTAAPGGWKVKINPTEYNSTYEHRYEVLEVTNGQDSYLVLRDNRNKTMVELRGK